MGFRAKKMKSEENEKKKKEIKQTHYRMKRNDGGSGVHGTDHIFGRGVGGGKGHVGRTAKSACYETCQSVVFRTSSMHRRVVL